MTKHVYIVNTNNEGMIEMNNGDSDVGKYSTLKKALKAKKELYKEYADVYGLKLNEITIEKEKIN